MMKFLKLALIAALGLMFALATPARTQTVPFQDLPVTLNTALCVNNWDRAVTIVQQMLGSPTTSAQLRQHLTALQPRLKDYRARGIRLDQRDACAAAIAPTQSHTIAVSGSSSTTVQPTSHPVAPAPSATCAPERTAADGRCMTTGAGATRRNQSLENGDR